MQVNISFYGTASGQTVLPNMEEASGIAAPLSDGGGSPVGSADSGIDVSVAYEVTEAGTFENIGSPPEWLHEAIAAYQIASASVHGASAGVENVMDGGQGPGV
jgi:hypothetical protein